MRLLPLALLASTFSVANCASKPPVVPPGKEPRPAASADAAVPVSSDPNPVIAMVAAKTIGPFLAVREHDALAAFIGPIEDGTRQLSVIAIAENGTQPPQRVAAVSGDTTSLVLRPMGDRAGFYAVYARLLDRGETLTVVALAPNGTPVGPPVDLVRTHDHLAWHGVVPTSRGALCFWAEETREGDANLLVVPLEPDGTARGVPRRLAQAVSGWQAVATARGAGLAITKRRPRSAGTLAWMALDTEGRAPTAPIPIAASPTVSGDVEVARVEGAGGGVLFAWTDRTGEEPEVRVASVDDVGRVQAPRRAFEAVGGSSLVGLVSGPAGTLLAWESPNRRARPVRSLELSRLSSSLEADALLTVPIAGTQRPEFAATDKGFALLASVHSCLPSGADCHDAPSIVRFEPHTGPLRSDPMLLGERSEPPSLAWSLACSGPWCRALAAVRPAEAVRTQSRFDGVQVHLVTASPKPTYEATRIAPPPPGAPRAVGLRTLATGEAFATVAAVKMGDGILVASLTAAGDEPTPERGRRREETGSSVVVRLVDGRGEVLAGPFTITARAVGTGGLALAAGGSVDDGAALAWVGRDRGDPQVHITQLDRRGKKRNEVQLTTSKGEASDVALVWVGTGWLAGWVDGRDGNGEVYAARVDRKLHRIGREERITNAPGDASELSLLEDRDVVWAAWADTRESPRDGNADIYVTALRVRDAHAAVEETRVLASAAHSRSPSLAYGTDGVTLAWLEESPLGLDARGVDTYGAMFVRLDSRAKPMGAAQRLGLAGEGTPTALLLTASRPLRALVARATSDDLFLDSVDLDTCTGCNRAPVTLLTLDGPPSLDLSLASVGDLIFFNDEADGAGERRIRLARTARVRGQGRP